jgi:arginase
MHVQIFVVPYDTGRLRWRCGLGPEHLLQAGLTSHLQRRGHVVADVQLIDDDPADGPAEIRTTFELARRLALGVRAASEAGRFPLVLSGNCNSALGTLSGLTPARRATFWFDAHGDYNTPETTTSGFLDGMGLAIATGTCWQRLATTVPGFGAIEPERTFLLGARDLDPPEKVVLEGSGVTPVAVDRIPADLPELLATAPLDDCAGYIHLDLDVLDPRVGRANELAVPDGLSVAQLTAAIAAVRARVPLRAAAITSYAPEEDSDQGIARAAFAAIDAMLSPGH